jgi:hypothetical protein
MFGVGSIIRCCYLKSSWKERRERGRKDKEELLTNIINIDSKTQQNIGNMNPQGVSVW